MVKPLLIFLLYLTLILTSYNGSIMPWRAALGSLLIMLIAKAIWRDRWRDWLGLNIRLRAAIQATILAPFLMILLYWVIGFIAQAGQITYQPATTQAGLFSLKYLHTLGQTLNEEMLFGALLLFALRQRIPQGHSLFIVVFISAVFALLHYIFYRWIVLPQFGGILTFGALFVLFAIGMLRNTLILKAGHIAYAWSLHLSINLVGLIGLYQFENGVELIEPQIFNMFLGSPPAVWLATFVLVLCCTWLLIPNNVFKLE